MRPVPGSRRRGNVERVHRVEGPRLEQPESDSRNRNSGPETAFVTSGSLKDVMHHFVVTAHDPRDCDGLPH